MSNRKRNISYVKPQDPKFLRLIKEQVGFQDFQETVDLKRQKLEDLNDSNSENEREEEQPLVVVLKDGDLTAEQAKIEQERVQKEETEKPADLNQRVIFKAKTKIIDENSVKPTASSSLEKKEKKLKNKKTKELKNKLSFGDDEEEEDS